MTFEDAASICDGGLNALWALRQAPVEKGQAVLVYGASGAIGTAGVQLARHFGAEVTAVCGAKNLDLVRSLGATTAIDYMKDDFTRNGRKYDVIFDAVGKHSFTRSRGSLKPDGSYLAADGLAIPPARLEPPFREPEGDILHPAPIHQGGRPTSEGSDRGGEYRGGRPHVPA
jgi:alcohol dehydrogenase